MAWEATLAQGKTAGGSGKLQAYSRELFAMIWSAAFMSLSLDVNRKQQEDREREKEKFEKLRKEREEDAAKNGFKQFAKSTTDVSNYVGRWEITTLLQRKPIALQLALCHGLDAPGWRCWTLVMSALMPGHSSVADSLAAAKHQTGRQEPASERPGTLPKGVQRGAGCCNVCMQQPARAQRRPGAHLQVLDAAEDTRCPAPEGGGGPRVNRYS